MARGNHAFPAWHASLPACDLLPLLAKWRPRKHIVSLSPGDDCDELGIHAVPGKHSSSVWCYSKPQQARPFPSFPGVNALGDLSLAPCSG